MSLDLIDSHAHLDLPDFAPDLDDVLIRADDAGVNTIITIGIDIPSSKKAIGLAAAHDNIYATVGIHPCDSAAATDETLADLAKLAASPKVVAIGETGLDFYHKPFSEAVQFKALTFQLDLAVQTGKPVVIHNRAADAAIVPLLEDWAAANPGHQQGVIHCFGGDIETADRYLKAGFHISLGSYVTYPSSRKSHDIYRYIPLERLLLETDCPFLPPQGQRGKRNEPSYLVQTVQALADIREIPVEELARATAQNARRLFGLPEIS
ncbi:TatD family hydrolase [Dehalogenimonas alkenigignens]|uniref:Hydrolase, TatD family n=1 Tax=Dehalogenimonas alkenigignens TaxID=1217799 RepID=A0A0W0GJF9_9CHLR|nr:TatD family hydrolase [Dehalogenimonas alkenigignens]KTB48659.1 hydrolase, TatD family [Dehalogenimonas alkenigignens]PVV84913.1 TatD family deoxyribonuclease [Dehalogenimonas alkenigignens]